MAKFIQFDLGMPAEVSLEGTTQTALQYLADPITSTIRRPGRQI